MLVPPHVYKQSLRHLCNYLGVLFGLAGLSPNEPITRGQAEDGSIVSLRERHDAIQMWYVSERDILFGHIWGFEFR